MSAVRGFEETVVVRGALRLVDGTHDAVTRVYSELAPGGQRFVARASFVDPRFGSGRVGGATMTFAESEYRTQYHGSEVVSRALATLVYPRRVPTGRHRGLRRYLDAEEVARMTHDEWDQAHRDGDEHLRLVEIVIAAAEAVFESSGEFTGPFPASVSLADLRLVVRDLDAGVPYEWAVRRAAEVES